MNENTILVSVLAAVLIVSVAGLYMVMGTDKITGMQFFDTSDFTIELEDWETIAVTDVSAIVTPTAGTGPTMTFSPTENTCAPACSVVGGSPIHITTAGTMSFGITITPSNPAPWPGSSTFAYQPIGNFVPPLLNPDCNNIPAYTPLAGEITALDSVDPGTQWDAHIRYDNTPSTTPGITAVSYTFNGVPAVGC